MFLRLLIVAALLCAGLLRKPATAGTPDGKPEIWFYPLDDGYRAFLKRAVSPDYMQLFRAGAPWNNVLAGLKVFVISAAVPLEKSPEELRSIFAFLRKHGIAIALQTQGLEPVPGCGAGLEAYRPFSEFISALQRINGAGGQLSYVSLDEPLWYAHSYDGKHACHTSIPQLAEEVASRLRAGRAIFPRLSFGDIEPVNVFKDGEMRPALQAWFDAFQAASGAPFAYFQADLDWNRPWKAAILQSAALSRQNRIPFGAIYTGNFKTQSDLEWTSQSLSRALAIERLLPPDQSVFESWMVHPTHVLPENDPASFTGLLQSFLADR